MLMRSKKCDPLILLGTSAASVFSLSSSVVQCAFDKEIPLQGSEFQGVLADELSQKLNHLLIERQEDQIAELESELHLAQSKLNEKEAELRALKDTVRRLSQISISTLSGTTFFLLSCPSYNFVSLTS